MSKPLSLLRFQFRVLSSFFRKGVKWNFALLKEFTLYLIYYFANWWYYLVLTGFESFFLNKHKALKKIDQKLANIYENENQFWVSLKEGYKISNEKITNLTYGETSYFAIKKSFEYVGLKEDDTFYDLGCGIGKTVFLANIIFNCKAKGIDIIPGFIKKANNLCRELKLKNISFIEKSIFEHNLKDGTVFYITPTCFDEENMKKLLEKFKSLPKGARLIVLTKNIQLPNLKPLGKKKLFYSWGIADTYYYEVI